MHFDRGAVQTNPLDPDRQNLLRLQPGKYPVQHPRLAPAVHPGVDGMPVAQMFRQAAPFTAMLDRIQQGVEQLQIGHADIATLLRQTVGDALILNPGQFHNPSLPSLPAKSISVNTL